MKRYSYVLVIFSFFLFNINAQDNSGISNKKENRTAIDSKKSDNNQTSINQLENPKFATSLANDLKKKIKLSSDQTEQVKQVLQDYQAQVNTAILEKNNFAGLSGSVTDSDSVSGTNTENTSVSGSTTGNNRIEGTDIHGTTTPPNTTGAGSLSTNPTDTSLMGNSNPSSTTSGIGTLGSTGTNGSVGGTIGMGRKNTGGSVSGSTGMGRIGREGSVSGSTDLSGSVSGSGYGSTEYDQNSNRAGAMSNSQNVNTPAMYSDDRIAALDKADEQAETRIESILDDTQKDKYSKIKGTWWVKVRQQALGKNWAAATSREEHMMNRDSQKHRRSSYNNHNNNSTPGTKSNKDNNNKDYDRNGK